MTFELHIKKISLGGKLLFLKKNKRLAILPKLWYYKQVVKGDGPLIPSVLRTSRLYFRRSQMNANEIIKNIEAEQLKSDIAEFHVGDTVKVHNKIKEGNRERIQIFEGTVIKRQGGSNRETFTVRKISNNVGVEKTWPLHSPNVEKIEVVRRGKVRRAKLNYLRDRVGKKAKVKELVK